MRIDFTNITQAGNNLRTEMYIDNIRVSELHCTPKEFDELFHLLEAGYDAIYTEVEVYRDDRPS